MAFVTNALRSISDVFILFMELSQQLLHICIFEFHFPLFSSYITLIKKAFQCRFMNAPCHYDCSHTEKFKCIYSLLYHYETAMFQTFLQPSFLPPPLSISERFFSFAKCQIDVDKCIDLWREMYYCWVFVLFLVVCKIFRPS